MKQYRITFDILDSKNKQKSIRFTGQIQDTYTDNREKFIFDLTERQEVKFYFDKLIDAINQKIEENFPE